MPGSPARAHAHHGFHGHVPSHAGDERVEELLHGSLLASELFAVGESQPLAAAAFAHDGAGAVGVGEANLLLGSTRASVNSIPLI